MDRKTADNIVTAIGIDIGKNTFHLVGLDERGAIVMRQKLSRGQGRTNQRDWFEEQAMRRLLLEEHAEFVEMALASDPKAAEFLGPKSGAH